MLRAQVAINHKDCWASEISKKFPGFQLLLVNTASINPHTSTVLLCARSKNPTRFEGLLKYFESRRKSRKIRILRFEVVERTGDEIFIAVTTAVSGSLVRKTIINNCFVTDPIILKGGEEWWTVTTTRKANVKSLMRDFAKVGDVSLKSVKKVSFQKACLTRGQKTAVLNAFSAGYYAWPRKVNLRRLAVRLGSSSSALRERLRKAENALVTENIDRL